MQSYPFINYTYIVDGNDTVLRTGLFFRLEAERKLNALLVLLLHLYSA